MERYIKEQRVIVKTNYKHSENYAEATRKVRYFRSIKCTKSDTGSAINQGSGVRVRPVWTMDNIAAVNERVADNPRTSIRHRSQQLNILRVSLQQILTKDLHFHVTKTQLTQKLKTRDHSKRRQFVSWRS